MRRKQAELLAKRLGMNIDERLGSGSNGVAFSTDCGKVIKVTKDIAEFCHATNMKGKELEYFANVEETFVFPNGNFGIVMEKLEICPEMRTQFRLLRELAESQGVDFLEVDIEDHDDFDILADLMDDLAYVYREDSKYKLMSSDLHEDNVGLKEDGTLAVFDLRYDNVIMTNVVNADKVVDEVKQYQKKSKEYDLTL